MPCQHQPPHEQIIMQLGRLALVLTIQQMKNCGDMHTPHSMMISDLFLMKLTKPSTTKLQQSFLLMLLVELVKLFTLPVVQQAGRAGIVAKTLKRCSFWNDVQILKLTINERVRRNGDTPEAKEFAKFLVDLGEGKLPLHPEIGQNMVRIPDKYIFESESVQDLIRWCYPDISETSASIHASGRAILAPKNCDVDHINNLALSLMQGEHFIFESADSVKSEEQAGNFPVEYLNSISASGLPPHKLSLKVGCPVILIRNLHVSMGL